MVNPGPGECWGGSVRSTGATLQSLMVEVQILRFNINLVFTIADPSSPYNQTGTVLC